MTIATANQTPRLTELLQALRARYSDKYGVNLFEFGEPSIIVKKSFWTGAQITIRNKEIELDFTYPNLISGLLGAMLIYLVAFSNITDSWYQLERELGAFLTRKYGFH
jgi:hypothetical protein